VLYKKSGDKRKLGGGGYYGSEVKKKKVCLTGTKEEKTIEKKQESIKITE